MIILKKLSVLATEFIYGGHLLSLGASGVALSIILFLELPINLVILLIPYFSTQVVYSYNHFKEIRFDKDSNPERASHINKRKQLTTLLFGFYLVALIILLIMTNIPTVIFVISIIVGGIIYTDYFKARIAKFITGSKNFYSAFFWALQILLVPLFYQSKLTEFYLYFFLIVFLTAFINSTFFDIKDIVSDKERNLKTFPVVWGIRKTVMFLSILKFLMLIPLILGIYSGYFPKSALIYIFFIVYGLYYLSQSLLLKGKDLRNLSYIVADGEYILWPIFIYIGKIIFLN